MYDASSVSLTSPLASVVCMKYSFPGCSASKEKANRLVLAETFSMSEEGYPMVSEPCWFGQPHGEKVLSGAQELVNNLLSCRQIVTC